MKQDALYTLSEVLILLLLGIMLGSIIGFAVGGGAQEKPSHGSPVTIIVSTPENGAKMVKLLGLPGFADMKGQVKK
jgi:ABC-type antimicrobial peptide transport system permease subunit